MLTTTKIKKLESLVLNYTAVAFGPQFGLKVSGGTGQSPEVQKKYSRKGKLNEKKFMHAN